MAGFASPLDIVNRALQRIGAGKITSLTDTTSIQAIAANDCYDKLRRAEYGRNNWRFAIARVALRAIESFNQTKFMTFATWVGGTTYAQSDIVKGSDSQIYYSLVGSNIGNDPTATSGFWALYFGPLSAQEFVTTWGSTSTYTLGDHAVGSDGQVYVSLIANNINNNPVFTVGTDWQIATVANVNDPTQATSTSWYTGELVFIGSAVYASLISSNSVAPPSANWLTLTTPPALAVPLIPYPIGSGPLSQGNTRNAYRLPANYLRRAPRDPHAGYYTVMGSPTNLASNDWTFENDYIVTQDTGPIIFRFVHDMSDVTHMNPLFCEGLASRIAFELCEQLTQSVAKLGAIGKEYNQFMGDARMQDGIEQGPTETELSDLLLVRY